MTSNGDGISGPEQPLRLTDLADSVPDSTAVGTAPTVPAEDQLSVARREFAVLLGEFRRTTVLVPIDPYGSLWTADQGGVRWICAFSDEQALAQFARAQGDAEREWTYQTILGARLLDVMVPMLPGPAGVALDAGSDEGEGMLFPPVQGIVPDAAAVDLGGME
ncbi:SseB family protein [Streptomyces sp. NBC_00133]|uniref:SseB family protein n=1 Tax=Streptomyces sp. NBC_00133 TaxID=2903624 RepID=UPI00324DD5D8